MISPVPWVRYSGHCARPCQAGQLQNQLLCSPCKCPLRVRSIKRTPAPQGPLIWARWMCFPVNVPPSPTGSRCLAPAGPDNRPHNPMCHRGQGSTPPCSPYLRRRWSGLLQGPPEKWRWAKEAEGGRLFTASSHGRIGDVGRRMGTRDLRLQAGQDTSSLNSARGTAGHGTVPPPLRLLLHSWSSFCSSTRAAPTPSPGAAYGPERG